MRPFCEPERRSPTRHEPVAVVTNTPGLETGASDGVIRSTATRASKQDRACLFKQFMRAGPTDVPTAGAILDRFRHPAATLASTGRSYRVKDSLPLPAENKQTQKPHEPSTAEAAS